MAKLHFDADNTIAVHYSLAMFKQAQGILD